MKTVILVILDGWGIGEQNDTNPISVADPETVKYIEKYYPAGSLNASGISVGLPWGEEGNSEVGHLTIGAGRVLYQHFMRITKSIESDEFFENGALKKSFEHAEENNSSVHIAGLLTEGNVHASIEHLKALIQMAAKENTKEVYLHLFADGRDSPPQSVMNLLDDLKKEIEEQGVGQISTLSGRYYSMDREGRWDRTQKAYNVMVGDGPEGEIEQNIQEAYSEGLNDEHIKPVMTEDGEPIKENDSIIFLNFREDSIRQITKSFAGNGFDEFETKDLSNLQITTMTKYDDDIESDVAFPPHEIKNTLGEVVAKNNKNQLRVAESEKSAHVTYFFNGLKKEAFDNEFRIIIPSQNVGNVATHPEMQADAITERILLSIGEGTFDLIVANYANPDIMAHTGNYNSTIEAVQKIDKQLNQLLRAAIAEDHTLIITSDHGNAEMLFDPKTGGRETKHNVSPVPFYFVDKDYQRSDLGSPGNLPKIGMLADVAPTILDVMDIQKPPEMTGNSLIDLL